MLTKRKNIKPKYVKCECNKSDTWTQVVYEFYQSQIIYKNLSLTHENINS